MAEFTYESRRKITDAFVKEFKGRGKNLSRREKEMLPDVYFSATPKEAGDEICQLLRQGTYGKLSDLYRAQFPNLVDVCVRKEHQEQFYYALDGMNHYQMTAGWFRRSLRSDSYVPFVEGSIRLLRAFAQLDFYGGSLADILTGKVNKEIYDHARNEYFFYEHILAAQIDLGVEETVRAVKDILFGEGNTLMMSRALVVGIVESKNRGLYEDLGKFLLAARLQEGARQVVCETMDAGQPEAFLHLFSVIEENDLIRYSSVKRAVATWIGIFDENSTDRVSEKLLRLMGQCLRDENFVKEQLATNDAVAISCALWAKGFYSAEAAVEAVRELVQNGTKQQKMTASYFMLSLQDEKLQMTASKEVFLSCAEDLELAACFMPSFMGGTSSYLYDLGTEKRSYGGYDVRDSKAVRPKPLAVTRLFKDSEEAEKIYGILKGILPQIPKKGLTLSPCIFPWYSVSMSQADIAERLCLIAWMLQKDELLDEAAGLLPLVGQGQASAVRAAAARVLLYRPESKARKKVLFELLHNAEEWTNHAAHKLVEAMELSAEDYQEIEQNLKYKKGRTQTLALLRKQGNDGLVSCIGRLLNEKSEECHMGALDLALQLKKEDKAAFAKVLPHLEAFPNPTGKEQVLLKELIDTQSEAQTILNTPGYGLYDTRKDWILPEVHVDESKISGLFTCGQAAYIDVLRKLDKLIGENREREYKTAWGDERMLGNGLAQTRWGNDEAVHEPLDQYPFRELWEEFYEKGIRTPQLLMETHLFLQCYKNRDLYNDNKKLYKEMFQCVFTNLEFVMTYRNQVYIIMQALFEQFVPVSVLAQFGLSGMARLAANIEPSTGIARKVWRVKNALSLPIFGDLCQWMIDIKGEDWVNSFALRFQLFLRLRVSNERELPEFRYSGNGEWLYIKPSDYVQSYVRGIWDKDLFYKAIFATYNLGSVLGPVSMVEQKGAVSPRRVNIRLLENFFGENALRLVDGKYHFDTIGDEMPEMAFAHELYREIIPVVLKVELKRGEQPTPFSGIIDDIYVIYGIDYMIQILTALGKDTLQRGDSYYTSATERKLVMSHLLKVSMPEPGETAEDLKKALKGTDITKKRLVELAMYAQQWIPMVEEYLALPGFASACYYFMAHTSEEFDEQVTSVIAKYTPLPPEELKDGAFDIHWFFEAYEKVGEDNFKLLYDAAKYSSSGAAHGRARKYADAALGKVEKDALKAEIDAKRNKDLLMSISLLPLPELSKAREEELLDRYQYIEKFKKESRQFGAQRRASETRAVEIALRNLSVNAGFTDVTRLVLRMEGKLAEQSEEYFSWQTVDETDKVGLMIVVDENGKSSLQCRKDGKILKSIPAKYKKNETVLQFQQMVKNLKEQYSRTRQMMEQAMEDRTDFEVWEYLELYRNPVTRPIAEPLVVMTADEQDGKLGFLTADGLAGISGNMLPVKPGDKIFIAHPFDLYKSGQWHEYQKALFERQIKQPFKQVFRELYVKLEEELDKEESMLFAGNQIQPQKTVGALRSRRWVADYEDGLQKVYYKENIVACIYAMADWFSPSDVEAPTLEYVVFSDRKTGKRIAIKDIPAIIYSEVMRDVDLAVSVAHAGGVDPETSHSTIEMRRAIVECNLSLFQTKNVRLEKNHAIIDGKFGQYTVHLGSGVVHQVGNAMLFVIPVHSQQRGRIFLPFVDDDPKTAEIMSKILLFAEDAKIKDPKILQQIQ